MSLLSTAVLMFLDTADMPTQTISLSDDAKEEDGGNQSVTESTLSWQYSSYYKMHVSKSGRIKNNFSFDLKVEDTVTITGKAFSERGIRS